MSLTQNQQLLLRLQIERITQDQDANYGISYRKCHALSLLASDDILEESFSSAESVIRK